MILSKESSKEKKGQAGHSLILEETPGNIALKFLFNGQLHSGIRPPSFLTAYPAQFHQEAGASPSLHSGKGL